MISAEIIQRLTPEQARRISLLGVQATELKRLALDPPDYPPIQNGLQLVNLVLDFRLGEAIAHHAFLFSVDGKKNRYEWIRNNKKQEGLIGWHGASRDIAGNVRPLINY